jgi:predicted phage-related endonuclease
MLKLNQLLSDRMTFIGGSDARVLMGSDAAAVVRLWREKRQEVAPRDLSRDLPVQLGSATEALNRRWFEQETGLTVSAVQHFCHHPTVPFMAATLDGLVEQPSSGSPDQRTSAAKAIGSRAVFEAKFMLPWSFSEEAAAAKHMPQLQHNMLVAGTSTAYLSIITGGGQWVLIEAEADPLYQAVLLQVERIFWRCVCQGEMPTPVRADPPKPKMQAVRVVDMSTSNAWAEHAPVFLSTLDAHGQHEHAKAELKGLMPEDAREATGHGLRAKRSRAGAVSFEVLANGGSYAGLQ